MRLSTAAVLRPQLQNLPLNRKPASIFEGGGNKPALPACVACVPVCPCLAALLAQGTFALRKPKPAIVPGYPLPALNTNPGPALLSTCTASKLHYVNMYRYMYYM